MLLMSQITMFVVVYSSHVSYYSSSQVMEQIAHPAQGGYCVSCAATAEASQT